MSNEISFRTDVFYNRGYSDKVEFTKEEFEKLSLEHPDAFKPNEPSIGQVTYEFLVNRKLDEITNEFQNEMENKGVLTSLGITMKYRETDISAVDGMVRYSQKIGMDKCLLIVDIYGNEYNNHFTIQEGELLTTEMFTAQLKAYQKLREIKNLIIELDGNIEELDKIKW
jgi:hypothetical protein